MYIGSSENLERRWKDHTRLLSKGRHHSVALQKAWDKYFGQLEFNTMLICREEDLLLYEQQYIDFYKPRYNMSLFAGSPMKGRNHSDETRIKMSATHTGKILSEETCKKISEAKKGTQRPAHVQAMLQWHNEQRKGKKFPGKGPKWTDEQKAEMSRRATGRKASDETKQKQSKRLMGNKNALGMKHSEETKRIISEKSKAFWAKKKAESNN